VKVTLLGTGTSQGVPVIGCDCGACMSVDHRDKRLRSGVLIEHRETKILIDTSPDLRSQMLTHKVDHVDAIIYTHEHNDHVIGLDDIRPFNFKQKKDMPLYGLKRVMDDIAMRFTYVFEESPYPGVPRGIIHHIKDKAFSIEGVDILPIQVMHGRLPILGYRFGDFCFITDASYIDEENLEKMKGTKILIINSLQREAHYSHFTLKQALETIDKVNPETAYLTHISHKMGPTNDWEEELPGNVFPSFDGLVLETI